MSSPLPSDAIERVSPAQNPALAPVVLYEFTDRLYRAQSQDDICDAALDAIARALLCNRASILLFDAAGVMRFVAWRGLSEGYRNAVEGHSPWTRDTQDPQPICIEDIDAADSPAELRAIVKAERIGALAFVPLVAQGELVGKFMTYYDAPHVFTPAEVELAVTIARQLGFSMGRMRAENALRQTQERLQIELAAAQQLQRVSSQLIQENDVQELYERILDAAMAIMHSDFASMQMLYPERGQLRLLAHRGFSPQAAAFWEWVRPGSGSTCGVALRTGERSVVADVGLSDFMAGTPDLDSYRQTGIRAVQSTPLVSRSSQMLGMISTHWRQPHQPVDHELRLLDVLARQAADLIERKYAEQIAQQAHKRQELLTQEIHHRTKNIFSVVQAVVAKSFSDKQTVEEARQTVLSRLHSLAGTHGLLLEKEWHGVELAEIVRMEMGPFADRVTIEGPPLPLNNKAAQNFGLAVHELATNAVKYGALSNQAGRVHISWSVGEPDGHHQFVFRWHEHGGPQVSPPVRKGFGSTVLERVMAEYFQTPQIEFTPDGVRYELAGPLDIIADQA